MVYSHNEIRHSNENERTTASHNNIDECHKRDVEQKIARYKRVHVTVTYIRLYSVQKQVELICGEVKTVIALEQVSAQGSGGWGIGSGGNVLYLDESADYMDVFSLRNVTKLYS